MCVGVDTVVVLFFRLLSCVAVVVTTVGRYVAYEWLSEARGLGKG